MNGENNNRSEAEVYYVQKPAKLPEIPNLSAVGKVPKRSDPFVLDDFRGVEAYTPPVTQQ